MIKTIIIDDEKLSREVLKILLGKMPRINILAEFSSPSEAISFLKDNSVDIIFLDIHMPNFNGFDFLNSIVGPPKVIITTSDKNKALESYEYESIVDYLVKPITQKRLQKSVTHATSLIDLERNAIKNEHPYSGNFYIKVNKKLVKIELDSILYIEANGDYVFIYKKTGRYIVNSSMKKIMEKLISPDFIKVHRSYIVNIRKITRIKENIILIDNKEIPISKTNKKILLEKLNLL